MNWINSAIYKEDIDRIAGLSVPWEKLQDRRFLISGASGLIGSFLIDVLMTKNLREGIHCKVFAIGRDKSILQERFSNYFNHELLEFVEMDLNEDAIPNIGNVDYVFHAASNTHPVQYSTKPIQTIMTNIVGTKKMLDYSSQHGCKRFVFASSNEIYGENRGDTELFNEEYCGYIDCNTLRAGYPESKRCGETLCQAYHKEKGMDVVIARFTRSYGPTMKMEDTKALSQFMKNALSGENIVLKSSGDQYYSYTYVADAVSGFLTILLRGESGEAYNIADVRSDIKLKDLAALIARNAGTQVIFELPGEAEAAGFSKATKARLSGDKLNAIGWTALYDIETGIRRTFHVLRGE